MKAQIYNLIILDESGSMCGVHGQTVSGCNETLNTIRSAQQKHTEEQEHFVSVYAFQSSGDRPSRYLMRNVPIEEVKDIQMDDYAPCGMTPLNDAIGSTLSDLKAVVRSSELAVGSVTVITDGLENSSQDYTVDKVSQMIEELKEQGWNFNFIGANIDVQKTAKQYSFDNFLEFSQDSRGMKTMFNKQKACRERYYDRMSFCMAASSDRSVLFQEFKSASEDFFDDDEEDERVTPDHITKLGKNEIFVFGSNLEGHHGGGAALVAYKRFGAVWGQGIGLQGQSYAIPTMHGGVENIRPYVDEFVKFAKVHSKMKFFVTRIGCGIAGFTDAQIAPLFAEAKDVKNIYLPLKFWTELKKG